MSHTATQMAIKQLETKHAPMKGAADQMIKMYLLDSFIIWSGVPSFGASFSGYMLGILGV